MGRVIQPAGRKRIENLREGVTLESFYPGGKDGPNGEALLPTPGGQTWSELIFLGEPDDPFQLAIPDIRLPANQLWPLHWHDCWTAVIILEGQCLIGDWWMDEGDVFIAEPSIEYGPLVNGPQGCRMFEVFAKMHLSPGGYAPEYKGHPTLEGVPSVFAERSPLNQRNNGKQVLTVVGTPGLYKTRLEHGAEWVLGDQEDPDRSFMRFLKLQAGEKRPNTTSKDWLSLIVVDGSAEVEGRQVQRDDFLVLRPQSSVSAVTAGKSGASILEIYRKAP